MSPLLFLLASAARAEAPAPPPLSAELRSLLSDRIHGGPLSSERARLLARPLVRVVIRASGPLHLETRGLGTVRATLGAWRSADVSWEALEILAKDPAVRRIELGPRLGMKPPVDHSASLIGVDQLRQRSGVALDGRGTLVVDFDTGVDRWSNQLFRPDGGLHRFVDVDGDGLLTAGVDTVAIDGLDVPVGLLDASVYDLWYDDETASFGYRPRQVDPEVDVLFADRDRDGALDPGELRLLGEDLDGSRLIEAGEELVGLSTPKVAATWDARRGLLVRGQGLDQSAPDTNGHGTSVASVLLAGQPGLTRWSGHAPGADLAAFNYLEAWELFDWVTAIDTALSLDPDVMLYEVGSFYGEFADGSSAFEQALVEAAARGAVQVCPAGNIGSGGKHGQRTVPPSGAWAGLYVYGPAEGYEVRSIGLTLVSRDGPFRGLRLQDDATGEEVAIPIDGGPVLFGGAILSAWSDRSERGSHLVLLQWSSASPIDGFHFLLVEPEVDSDVHLWLSDDGSSWSGGAVNFVPSWGFDPAYSWGTGRSSIVVPATSDACVSLGSYQARADVFSWDESPIDSGGLSWFSGQGPRIDGERAVDLAAPGHYDIRALGTSELFPPNSWTLFSGTSAAGPHVAAAAAILRQASPGLAHQDAEAALQETADRSTVGIGGNYDDSWGYGRLEAAAAVLAADAEGPRFRVLRSASRWSPLTRFAVIASEPLEGAPRCETSGGPVALRAAGSGVWVGHSPEPDLSCEGADPRGNIGAETAVVDLPGG